MQRADLDDILDSEVSVGMEYSSASEQIEIVW